jgi:hypothetical protein
MRGNPKRCESNTSLKRHNGERKWPAKVGSIRGGSRSFDVELRMPSGGFHVGLGPK